VVPIIAASFALVTAGGVSLAFGRDLVVHHVPALAKLQIGSAAAGPNALAD